MIAGGQQSGTIKIGPQQISVNDRDQIKTALHVIGCEVRNPGQDSQSADVCKQSADRYLDTYGVKQSTMDAFMAGANFCGRHPDVRYSFAEDSAACMNSFLENPGNYKHGARNNLTKNSNPVTLPLPHGVLDLTKAAQSAGLEVENDRGFMVIDQNTNALQVLTLQQAVAQPQPPQPQPQPQPQPEPQPQPQPQPPQAFDRDMHGSAFIELTPDFDDSNRTGVLGDLALSIPLTDWLTFNGEVFYWKMPTLLGDPTAALRKDYFGGDHWTDINFFLTHERTLSKDEAAKKELKLTLDFGNVNREYFLFPGFGGKATLTNQFSERFTMSGGIYGGTGQSNIIDFQGQAAAFADGGFAWSAWASAKYVALKREDAEEGLVRSVPVSASVSYAPAGADMAGMPDFLGAKLSVSANLLSRDAQLSGDAQSNPDWVLAPKAELQIRRNVANDRDRTFLIAGFSGRQHIDKKSAWLLEAGATRYLGSRGGDHTNVGASSNTFDDPATGADAGEGLPGMSVGQDAWELKALVGYGESEDWTKGPAWSAKIGLMHFRTQGYLDIGDGTAREDTASKTFGVFFLQKRF